MTFLALSDTLASIAPWILWITIGVGAALVLFHLVMMLMNFKKSIPVLIGIGAVIVIIGLFYALAGNSLTIGGYNYAEGEIVISKGVSKLAGGLVSAMIFMVLGAFAILIASLVRDSIQNR